MVRCNLSKLRFITHVPNHALTCWYYLGLRNATGITHYSSNQLTLLQNLIACCIQDFPCVFFHPFSSDFSDYFLGGENRQTINILNLKGIFMLFLSF